jgi:hypothetical protein
LGGGSARHKAAIYTQDNINTHRHPCLEWDSNPRSQVFEQAKTVHALDCTATVIGKYYIRVIKSMIKIPGNVARIRDLVVDGTIKLELILKEYGIKTKSEFNWLRIGFRGRLCFV